MTPPPIFHLRLIPGAGPAAVWRWLRNRGTLRRLNAEMDAYLNEERQREQEMGWPS